MYSPAFQMLLADARVEDLRRARATLIQPHGSREGHISRAAAGWGLLSRVGIRRLVFADPSRAN
jgi:hypothetical protein